MKAFNQDDSFVQSQDQVSTALQNETVALSLTKGTYYRFNAVGAWIWEQLTEEVRGDALCRRVMRHFAVSEADCEAAVADFLQALQGHGLVTRISAGDA